MLANARSLGYVFDPLTTYFCFDAEGRLEGVLAEVHNTYGERHCYPLEVTERSGASVDKEFYVSPFFAVEGRYDIRTRLTGSQVAVAISLTQETPRARRPSSPPRSTVASARPLADVWSAPSPATRCPRSGSPH